MAKFAYPLLSELYPPTEKTQEKGGGGGRKLSGLNGYKWIEWIGCTAVEEFCGCDVGADGVKMEYQIC